MSLGKKSVISRLGAVAVSLAAFLPHPVLAGDVATLNVLGFSADGSLFAFEEYGIQDGSGFPYANRFYIDTATDSFVVGSPIRVRLDEDMPSAEEARSEARAQGEAIISDAELAANPGYMAGFNPVSELSADPHTMTVNPRPAFPAADDPLTVRIEELHFPVSSNCEGITDTGVGFRLVGVSVTPDSAVRLLHEDSSVPSSRGCTLGYRIGGVQTFWQGEKRATAVLVAIESFGFEGPDYRWMAVTSTDLPGE